MAIVKLSDVREDLKNFRAGLKPKGWKCGIESVDRHYRPEMGYLSIWTGIPSSGKSEVLDAILVNQTILHGWRHAIYSPENHPTAIHYEKLMEKYTGIGISEMTDYQWDEAKEWVDEYFTFIEADEEELTVDRLLHEFKIVLDTYGASTCVLDPWNDLCHDIGNGSETLYINNMLTKIRRFAQKQKTCFHIVAHPTKLQKDKDGNYPVPSPYDISGSAAWRNRADFCLTVHRKDIRSNEPKLYIQKVKYKFFGKPGEVQLYYDYRSGRLKDQLHDSWRLPT